MKSKLYCKILTVGIIVLFIGVGVSSSTVQLKNTHTHENIDDVYDNLSINVYNPDINVWGKQILASELNRVRFPGVTLAPNGDLVMVYCRSDNIDYSCWMELWCRISHDNGNNWEDPFMIHKFPSYCAEIGFSLITAPNGDLCFLFCDDHEWDVHNGTDIWRNSHNGSQGNWYYSGNFSEFGKCYVYDWITFGDKMYAFVNDPNIFQNCISYLGISEDSGYTWSKFGNNIDNVGGEWSTIPLNSVATHWMTINRFTKFGNGPSGTSSCGSKGSGLPYSPFLEQYETTDGGLTWTETNSNCPDACGTSSQTSNQFNKGNYMWWLDNKIIIANCEGGESPNAYAAIWINSDYLSNSAWSNHIILGLEGNSGNAYSRGCVLPKRPGNIGGWGYVVWSENSNSIVKGAWVANNASLIWEWPPGPDNRPPNSPIIDGPTNAKIGIDYDFTFNTTDPDGDDIWYHIGWGDKEIIYIYGPYHSGELITLSYNWSSKGNYIIQCKAVDEYYLESNWSELEINIPRNRAWLRFIDMFPILQRLLNLV